MALNSTLARLGVTGAVVTGAVGIVAPTDLSAWASGLTDVGYISNEGVTESRSEDRTPFTPWQSRSPIRTEVTSATKTFAFTMWETNLTTVSLYYAVKPEAMTETGSGALKVVSFAEPEVPSQDRRAFGIDVIDGIYARRAWLPNGEVTERGDITYHAEGLISYPVTVTAYPSNGVSVLRLFREGWSKTA